MFQIEIFSFRQFKEFVYKVLTVFLLELEQSVNVLRYTYMP